jgi:osmotically-inducible protein OsmY
MADRWNEERERDWRERRAERYGRDDDYGSGDYERRDYALGDYDTGYRSFQPRDRSYGQERDYGRNRERGPVFGERETGASYTGPRYGAGGYTGYLGGDEWRDEYRNEGGRSYGGQDHDDQNFAYRPSYGRGGRGGRYYGDDGRTPVYRTEIASASPSDRTYSDYHAQPYGGAYDHPPYRENYRRAYGGRGRDYGHDRGRNDDRGQEGFWDRAQRRVASWFGEDDDDRGSRQERHAGHRGRGPQGYKRSDERISDDAHERLTDDPYLDASNVTVSVSGGEVTLAGTVTEREAKHRAERIVEDLSGVTHVQNNIRVERGNPLTGAGRGFGDSASEAQTRNAGTGDGDLTLSGKSGSRSTQ